MVLTISVLSVERYVAICHPFLFSKHTLSSKSRVLKIILVIWIVAFLCSYLIYVCIGKIPFINDPNVIAFFHVNERTYVYYGVLRSVFFFLVPMLLIGTMYFRISIELKKSSKFINNVDDNADNSKQGTSKMLSNNVCHAQYFSN